MKEYKSRFQRHDRLAIDTKLRKFKEKKFAAGEGFWIQPSSSVANAKVYFPNPFYKAAE